MLHHCAKYFKEIDIYKTIQNSHNQKSFAFSWVQWLFYLQTYFVEGVGYDMVILTNQVRDSFKQLHKIKLLLVTPALILVLAEISSNLFL